MMMGVGISQLRYESAYYCFLVLFLLKPIEFPPDQEVVQVVHSSSGNHVLALTNTGKVYSWGQGSNGVLGLNDTE